MAYTPTVWENDPSTGTPVSAANLNKLESGVDAAHTAVDSLDADVSTHVANTAAHGATSSPTPSTPVRRDAGGGTQLAAVRLTGTAAPAADHAVKREYVDAATSPRVMFPIGWTGTAWEFDSLAAAEAAGLRDSDWCHFIGNPTGAPPSWAPAGRSLWSQGG